MYVDDSFTRYGFCEIQLGVDVRDFVEYPKFGTLHGGGINWRGRGRGAGGKKFSIECKRTVCSQRVKHVCFPLISSSSIMTYSHCRALTRDCGGSACQAWGGGGGEGSAPSKTVQQAAKLFVGWACNQSLQQRDNKSTRCWLGRLSGCWKLGE